MRTRLVQVMTLVLAASGAQAQCLDTNGDGHPIFGHTFQRTDVELIDGQLAIARATGVAFGDLDGDGDLDAVCAGAGQGADHILQDTYMSVLLNHADGVYGSPVHYKAGREVVMPVLADFDLDGDLDVAVTNARDDTVSVLFNDGDGAFAGETVYATGAMPRSLVAADLDGDGDADLAVLNVEGSGVSVLLNNGDGTFAPQTQFIVGAVTPRGDLNLTFPVPGPFLAAGDLDSDGDVDLAIPAGGQVRILVNDGTGAFSLAPEAVDVVGFPAYGVEIADLNADGLADLAVVVRHPAPTAVNVAINQGNLSFADAAAYSADFAGCPECVYDFLSIAAGDLEGDGAPDLVVGTGAHFTKQFALFRNAGDGTFGPVEVHNVFRTPWVVELADVSGDGHDDFIALTHPIRSGMRIYLNDGQGDLIEPQLIATEGDQSEQNWRMAAGDMDGDGDTDVATVRAWSNVELFEGHADGTFTFRGDFDVAAPGEADLHGVAMGDLNGDGLADLAFADAGEGSFLELGAVRVALQTAPFQFEALEAILLDDTQAYRVALADMDSDGDLDAVAWLQEPYPGDDLTPVDRRLMVLLNDGAGNLTPAHELTFASHTWSRGTIEVGDIDGDGDPDVIAGSGPLWTRGQLTVLINDGTGALSIASITEMPPHPQSIRLRDLNGDGSLDLALLFNHSGSPDNGLALQPYLSIAMNDGAGTFAFTQEVIDINSHSNGQLVAADLDNDGDLDLALPDAAGFFEVHLNNGAGVFGPGARYTGIEQASALAAADADQDGRVDLIGANRLDPGITVFRNRSCPPCTADMNGDGSLNVLDFVAFQQAFMAGEESADCDGDGALTNPADFACFQAEFAAGCE